MAGARRFCKSSSYLLQVFHVFHSHPKLEQVVVSTSRKELEKDGATFVRFENEVEGRNVLASRRFHVTVGLCVGLVVWSAMQTYLLFTERFANSKLVDVARQIPSAKQVSLA